MPFRVGKGRSNFRFIVRGKTGERDVILRSAAARRLDKLLAKRRDEERNSVLFVMLDGSEVISLIDQFNTALRDAGIERNGFGEKYSLTATLLRSDGFAKWSWRFRNRQEYGDVSADQQDYGKQATSAVFATRSGD